MQTYISMLRGINVSGQKKIHMAELKSLYESLGLGNVQTYVQSGNVVFDSAEQDIAKLTEIHRSTDREDFWVFRTGPDPQCGGFPAHYREPSVRAGRTGQSPGHVFG